MKEKLLRMPRILLMVYILLSILVVAALAYLSVSTGSLTNTFKPAEETDPTISETFDNTTKTNVTVNVGDIDYAVYVRAAIVATWQDSTGKVHWQKPEHNLASGNDYVLDWNRDEWFYNPNDGYFYRTEMVKVGDPDPVLINQCYQIYAGPDVYSEGGDLVTDYKLNVKIITQTIQALGTTDAVDANGDPTPAVKDAWKVVTVDSNGSLIPITP